MSTKPTPPAKETYVLGHSQKEIERLQKQNDTLQIFTWRCFQEAGIKPGMKVLEAGCGGGDVALLLAEMVGPEGQVVGVDLNPQALEAARQKVEAAGHNNIIFKQGNLQDVALDADFDAVVGRLVLFHLKEPAKILRHLLNCLKPGGLVVFQDYNLLAARAYPFAPLFDQTLGRIIKAFRLAGSDPEIGLKLNEIFRQVGLPGPTMRCEASVSAGPEWDGYEQLAMLTRTLLPFMQKVGLAAAGEVEVATLADRLRAEITEMGGVGHGPDVISAWSHKSA
jgi:ubiquinone/menaquinone biosynthesis C-methylase UbiE